MWRLKCRLCVKKCGRNVQGEMKDEERMIDVKSVVCGILGHIIED